MRTDRYLPFIKPLERLITKKVLQVNPTIPPLRKEPAKSVISVYEYDSMGVHQNKIETIEETFEYLNSKKNVWINLDGLKKADVDRISEHFGIHPLIAEDILSSGQRPKMDELNHLIFCLLNMLYFNTEVSSVESEQISIVLGSNFVLSFQEDASRDVFDLLRQKIKIAGSKVRDSKVDYLILFSY